MDTNLCLHKHIKFWGKVEKISVNSEPDLVLSALGGCSKLDDLLRCLPDL